MTPARIKVAVTGASGRTGRLVVQRLLLEPDKYDPVAVVRSRQAAEDMTSLFAAAAAAAAARSPDGGGESNGGTSSNRNNNNNNNNNNNSSSGSGSVHIVDFAQGLSPDTTEEQDQQSTSEAELKLRAAFRGCRAVVVASGAVAEPQLWSSLASGAHVAASRLLSAALGRAATGNAAFVPVATWKGGQAPREVDWLGARRIFRAFFAAVAEQEEECEGRDGGGGGGVGGHVVLISSAGGCDPGHFLNRIAAGEVLNWKRRAEMDLIGLCAGGAAAAADGGKNTKQKPSSAPQMTYTILHPNHLIDGGRAPKPGALPRSALEFFDPTPAATADKMGSSGGKGVGGGSKGGAEAASLPRQRMLLAVDDALQRPHWSRRPRVPRAALAELSVQCVALARPAAHGGWCRWEEGEGVAEGAVRGAPAPARNRSIDVGVAEGKAVAVAGGEEAGVAEAAAAAARAEAAGAPDAGNFSAGGMTRLLAALLRAMPRDCDYAINDRTAADGGASGSGGGLQWACR